MKRFIIILSLCAVVFSFSVSIAQQKSISVLIRTSLNGANEGFPSYINDALPDSGEWKYKVSSDIVNQFAGVSGVNINTIQDYKSVLMNEELYTINRMRINSDEILLPSDISGKEDSLVSYYNNAVNFFKNDYGTLLNFTDVIVSPNTHDFDNKPLYIIYFYEKSIDIPDSQTDINELEKQLDILIWFSVELRRSNLNSDAYFISYRINGAQKQ